MTPKPANVIIARKPCGCLALAIPAYNDKQAREAISEAEQQNYKPITVSWFFYATTILTQPIHCQHTITTEVTA
jgi:hypothetical protein